MNDVVVGVREETYLFSKSKIHLNIRCKTNQNHSTLDEEEASWRRKMIGT